MRITAAPLPLSSPPGTTFRGALHLYSQGDTDGLCIIQHDNCIKHEHSSTVLHETSLLLKMLLFQMFEQRHIVAYYHCTCPVTALFNPHIDFSGPVDD